MLGSFVGVVKPSGISRRREMLISQRHHKIIIYYFLEVRGSNKLTDYLSFGLTISTLTVMIQNGSQFSSTLSLEPVLNTRCQ